MPARWLGIEGNEHDPHRDPLQLLTVLVKYLYFVRSIVVLMSILNVAFGTVLFAYSDAISVLPGYGALGHGPGGARTWGLAFLVIGLSMFIGHWRRDFAVLRWSMGLGVLAYAFVTACLLGPVVVLGRPPTGVTAYGALAILHFLLLKVAPK